MTSSISNVNKEKCELLKKATSLDDIAFILGYKPKYLAFILYKLPIEQRYTSFTIKKKNGSDRVIMAPNKRLKGLQRRLASLLSDFYETNFFSEDKPCNLSHGFRKEHSIISNAEIHRNKRFVFNIDLKDFFPSLNFGRVRGFFMHDKHFKLNEKVATIIAQIACYENQLPQGSPCSPIISNLIGHILDARMVKIAKAAKCTYSRYADDLTFSTNLKEFPRGIAFESSKDNWVVGEFIKNEITKTSFQINEKKTSMQYNNSRQLVTGLVVNEKVNVKRDYYLKARSYCHSLFHNNSFQINGEEGTVKQLDGILNFVYSVKRFELFRPLNDGLLNPLKFCATYDNKKSDFNKGINSLYKKFLFFKYFFSTSKPLIICEGKTDPIYLRCALSQLMRDYKNLISIVEKDKKKTFAYNLQFFKFSEKIRILLSYAEGSSAICSLLVSYDALSKKFKRWHRPSHPVIILLDTDSGAKPVVGLHTGDSDKKKPIPAELLDQPFIKYKNGDNIYITFVSKEKDKEIEDLFDEEVLNREVDGKKFKKDKKHGANESSFEKQIFAEKVVMADYKNINFDKFKYIFDNINAIIADYNKNNA